MGAIYSENTAVMKCKQQHLIKQILRTTRRYRESLEEEDFIPPLGLRKIRGTKT